MPNGVHALVNSMEPSGLRRSPDRVVGVTEPSQLPNRDDAVLSACKSGQSLPSRQSFYVHTENKLCRGSVLPRGRRLDADYAEV